MTYLAIKNTFTETLETAKFSSLRDAKKWARLNIGAKLEIIILDESFETRKIKLFQLNGKNTWTGSAPKSWFSI